MNATRKLPLFVIVLTCSGVIGCELWVRDHHPATVSAARPGVRKAPVATPTTWDRLFTRRAPVNRTKLTRHRRRLAHRGPGFRIGGRAATPLGIGWQWRGWSSGGSSKGGGLTLAKAPASGSEEALVTVILFFNFRCYYGNYVWSAFNDMKREFPGMFRLYFKHHQINRYNKIALVAAQAAMAAHAEGKFWEMADILFQNRYNINAKNLETYAEEIGLDMPAYKKAMKKGTYRAYVERDVTESKRFLKSRYGCPTVWINGKRQYGYISTYRLKNMLRAAAKEVQGIRIRPLL